MFKVGDIVEITAEAAATGMLDFTQGWSYRVHETRLSEYGGHLQVFMLNDSGATGWYHQNHFKLKGEEAMEDGVKFKIGDTLVCTEINPVELSANSITTGEEYVVTGLWEEGVRIVTDDGEELGVCDYRFKLKEGTIVEKKECLFKVGQVVWDVVYGKGTVVEIAKYSTYPVVVQFPDETMAYSEDGKTYETHGRTLFFSEPKIEAATEPLFEPALKYGDVVMAVDDSKSGDVIVVRKEDENVVTAETGISYWKSSNTFYRLGEEINFK